MSLATPEKIRTLRKKLYLKAKAEPDFRFYLLYDKVWRADMLEHAYELACENDGAAGVDGVTFDMIEAAGLDEWLSGIEKELRERSYRPDPVRRVMIPKPNGGERPLGIPTIRDRVVQTAMKLVIEPIFEADLEPNAYGYRPGRSAGDAVEAVHGLLRRGYTDVVDADLSKYFDTIPHDQLMRSVARRIVDKDVLRLIKMWLKAPVEETDKDGRKRLTGGKRNKQGTPQGGVISPLLANLYMNRFLKHWRLTEQGSKLKAHVIAYADDFVILSRGGGESVGGRGHDPPGVEPQRSEDLAAQCVEGTLRLSRLQLRTPLLPKRWPAVSRRQPVEEERGPSQAADQCNSPSGQQ
jgi:RNA-directed DNA polymerase